MGISPVTLDVSNLPAAGGDNSGNDTSGWLSGLGDLFTGIGTAVSSGLKASNTPTAPSIGSGWVYNAATGQYYNPVTGQALTSTGTLTSSGGFASLQNSPLFLILLLLGGIFLFRHKAA